MKCLKCGFHAFSSEPGGGGDFDQTCIDTLLGEGEELIRFGDLDLNFKVILALSKIGFP